MVTTRASTEIRREPRARSDEPRLLLERLALAKRALQPRDTYRIRLHITKIDEAGVERDLGPWPDAAAQLARLEDATDLCSMLSHHLQAFLFRSSYPS